MLLVGCFIILLLKLWGVKNEYERAKWSWGLFVYRLLDICCWYDLCFIVIKDFLGVFLLLYVNNVFKSFGGKNILNGVNLHLDKGSVYGLIGKNGAGKTTLMNIISGLTPASNGECSINGEISGNETLSKGMVGYLLDVPVFYEYLTTKEFIDFLLLPNHSKQETIKLRDEILNKVMLKPDTKIKSMSRGMRQKLGIACAMITNPDLILLDEPTSALDPQGRAEILNIIKILKDSGKSVLLSSHILSDMEKVCDKVGFLKDGVITEEITLNDIFKNSNRYIVEFCDDYKNDFPISNNITVKIINLRTVIFELNENVIASQKELFEYLSKCKNVITNVSKQHKTLDEYFKEYAI